MPEGWQFLFFRTVAWLLSLPMGFVGWPSPVGRFHGLEVVLEVWPRTNRTQKAGAYHDNKSSQFETAAKNIIYKRYLQISGPSGMSNTHFCALLKLKIFCQENFLPDFMNIFLGSHFNLLPYLYSKWGNVFVNWLVTFWLTIGVWLMICTQPDQYKNLPLFSDIDHTWLFCYRFYTWLRMVSI